MLLHPTIFRAYDIRGTFGKTLDAEGFVVLGEIIGEYAKQGVRSQESGVRIFLSGDGRQSMPVLYPAIKEGLETAGCQVVDGGILPTPLNLFAFYQGNYDLTIQISASHNPAEDNGVKMTDRKGDISGEAVLKFMEGCEVGSTKQSVGGEEALHFDTAGYFAKYIEKLQSMGLGGHKQKIIVDAGNGVTGAFYPKVLEAFGHEVIPLHCELDTTFPNHQPDPEEVENMRDAQAALLSRQADIAFVFDGDGDRLGIIINAQTSDSRLLTPDSSPFLLSQDHILYVLAADMLSRHPGSKVVIDAMSSDILAEKIKALGGQVIRTKTGHSFIKEAMEESGALFGGEQSGHFMFAEDYYGYDDAILAALRFLQAIERNPALLEEITTGWPSLLEYSEKFTVPDDQKFDIMNRYASALQKDFPDADLTDGIRLSFGENQWAIIRPSNTSPKISLRLEAKDEQSLEEKKEILTNPLTPLITQP